MKEYETEEPDGLYQQLSRQDVHVRVPQYVGETMSKYGEKVATVGLVREKGWLYYIDKEGDISRSMMKPTRKKLESGTA